MEVTSKSNVYLPILRNFWYGTSIQSRIIIPFTFSLVLIFEQMAQTWCTALCSPEKTNLIQEDWFNQSSMAVFTNWSLKLQSIEFNTWDTVLLPFWDRRMLFDFLSYQHLSSQPPTLLNISSPSNTCIVLNLHHYLIYIVPTLYHHYIYLSCFLFSYNLYCHLPSFCSFPFCLLLFNVVPMIFESL